MEHHDLRRSLSVYAVLAIAMILIVVLLWLRSRQNEEIRQTHLQGRYASDLSHNIG